MGSNGNIIKIANGNMQETAKQEYTSFAKTMESNAAQKVNEKSADGVVFGKPEEMKYETVDSIDILAAVFFDGTLNNRNNTAHKNVGKGVGSYGNDLSNVARLFDNYKESAKIIKTYIEGIGTLNDQPDKKYDAGFGDGDTGIPAKVMKGCDELAKRVAAVAAGKVVGNLTIDVFGFSRGAAAARSFVHEVSMSSYRSKSWEVTRTAEKNTDIHGQPTSLEVMPKGGELGRLLLKKEIKFNKITVRFVGLFDTVSSFNKGGFSVNPDFGNDVEELNLNDLHKAEKVIHLTAADEHRVYFSLTRIQSAKEKGIERDLPGVHSDVGGSYPNATEEVDEIINGFPGQLETEKLRLIEEGWYTEEQLDKSSWTGKLSGTRSLKKDYSFIPLHFMCEFAMGMPVPLFFDMSVLTTKFPISEDPKHLLGFIKARLHKYVFGQADRLVSKPFKQLDNDLRSGKLTKTQYDVQVDEQKQLRLLRNKFLHWSADYNGTFETMKPNIEDGVRKRIPHEG